MQRKEGRERIMEANRINTAFYELQVVVANLAGCHATLPYIFIDGQKINKNQIIENLKTILTALKVDKDEKTSPSE